MFRYLRGEGCGAIVLVPTDKAKSGSIYANILGTSVMSDGTSVSITAPNGSAQKRLIEKALQTSNLKPSGVDYIESHGTGTALGDPIEVEALAEVFDTSRSQSNLLTVGAVKSNIDQDRSLFDDPCEGSHEGLVERSGKHERSGHDTKRSIVTREFGNPLARSMEEFGR